jgi:plasmid stabilization system protein ParE
MADQAGMQAVNAAVAALADDPEPPAAFIHGEYRRLRVDSYRVMYVVEGDRITVLRVDRISSGFLLSCWGI